jgi:hypothetical protein
VIEDHSPPKFWKAGDPQVSTAFQELYTGKYTLMLTAYLIVAVLASFTKQLQVCVLVSTYIRHGLMLTALISSLLSTNYPYIDIILLDTDLVLDSREWMNNTATMLNSRSDNSGRRKDVHISTYSQREVQRRFPQITNMEFG